MNQMQQCHDLMLDILENGTLQANRTGTDAYTTQGRMVKFDLQKGFPAITTKKLAFKSVVGELLGFFRGYTSAADFRALGCKVWDANANETQSWVNSPFRKGVDDLGRIYSRQWTDWQDTKVVPVHEEHLLPDYAKLGYRIQGALTLPDGQRAGTVIHRNINQLENALRDLITNPTSRRIIINAWNPAENDQIALVACHAFTQFICDVEKKEMHLCLDLRSSDQFLGSFFNYATYGIFLELMARFTGYTARQCIFFLGDVHCYSNHAEQIREMAARPHFPAPKLIISDRVKKIERVEDIAGVFTRIEPEDIWLEGYQSHAAIKAPMAA